MRSEDHLRRPSLALITAGCSLLVLGLVTPAGALCPVDINCYRSFSCGFVATDVISYSVPGGAGHRNLILFDPTPCNSFPGTSAPAEQDLDIQYNIDVTTDLVHWTTVIGTAHGRVRRGPPSYPFEQTEFDTEILQLDISGGQLPAGLMIRESPTLASPGHTNYPAFQWLPGIFVVNSFFDVFTELSLDGGQTWTPGDGAAHLYFQESTPTPTVQPTWGSLKMRYR